MMLDLPELLAPARMVSGLTSIRCSSLIDLNPATEISEMPPACSGRVGFFALAMPDSSCCVPQFPHPLTASVSLSAPPRFLTPLADAPARRNRRHRQRVRHG